MTAPDLATVWGGDLRGSNAAIHIKPYRAMLAALVALAMGAAGRASAIGPPSVEQDFAQLAADCAPHVHVGILRGLVRTESSWNPYAIGVVGGRLARQPTTHQEAVATARALAARGYNFSMGLAQVNRANLAAYGESIETVLEPCRNLRAGGAILTRCYQRSQQRIADEAAAWRAALSCYYSGSFERGQRPDAPGGTSYVERVLANTDASATAMPIAVMSTAPPVAPSSVKERRGGAAEGSAMQSGRPAVVSRPSRPDWVRFVDDGIGQSEGGVSAGAGSPAIGESATAVLATSDESLVRIVP